jgi:lipoprotein-anchoring transpeptidase ErfK/SrfK
MIVRTLFAILLLLAGAGAAAADVVITIDKDQQRMTVFDGKAYFMWRVSTGAPGYGTPTGSFQPLRMAREHYSKEWDDAPMPHSIFFTERGHAIHGTSHKARLGTPASHGCVRLAPENAAYLFQLVEQHGLQATRIEVIGDDADTNVALRPYEPPRRRHREIDLFQQLFGGIAWR